MRLPELLFVAARNPRYAVTTVARGFLRADEQELARVLGSTRQEARRLVQEPAREAWFMDHLRACSAEIQPSTWLTLKKTYRLLYAAIRLARPDLVVETGVANGLTTSLILLALEKNQRGALHSIEISEASWTPGKRVGWVIPERLRARWTLHLGDSRTLLPSLLSTLKAVPVFFHDSLHEYDHMMFEYTTAFPHIAPGGLLLSDDVPASNAFRDFAKRTPHTSDAVIRGLGVLKK
jgi:predicted O-methyltransferase YrrM